MTYVVNPWQITADDQAFFRLVVIAMAVALLLSVVVPWIPVPDKLAAKPEEPVRQYAELILPKPIAKPKPEPKPEPKPKVVEEIKPKEVVKVEPEPVVPVEKEQTVKEAREKAKTAGLLAFQDDFKQLRESLSDASLSETGAVHRGAGKAAELDRSVLTAKKGGKQASVNVSDLSTETGGIALAGRETTVVEADPEVRETGVQRKVAPVESSERSIEEVRRVFDANKGAIYAIYNRALRSNPDLLGKVVLELVIEPNGMVSECLVMRSEIDDNALIDRIVQRVQMFNFGEKNVAVTRISYPVHFLPT